MNGRVLECRAYAAISVAVACLALCAPAAARPFAPLDQSGPRLHHDRDALRASLTCTGDLRDARRTPVLLLSGTTVDPGENFSWNWMPALQAKGFPWCASTAPEPDNMEDVQARGEYNVYAIRTMYRRAGRRVAIFGHSQGGMVGRWPLRFWPSTRHMVKDVIGAAPSNHGTNAALGICSVECPAAFWQQRTGSDFITALNSRREAMPRIGYTNIYTHYDMIVVLNRDDTGRSSLQGPGRITNVAAQDICPLNVSDHLAIGTVDPLAWALFLDAVRHRGPANPARIKPSACSQAYMPGVDPRTVATDLAAAATALATTSALYPRVRAEPKLRNYVFKR